MKFLLTKELHQNPLLKLLVVFFIGIIGLFLVSDVILHHYQIGLTPLLASESLLGNEATFVEPMLFDVLLERVHIDIFISMITLMLVAIIYIRISNTNSKGFIHIAFISAILTHISLLLAYFYGTIFAVSWIVLFFLWHILALYFSLTIIWQLLRS